jgi:glycosyltransferase involved in cell wall biosynthesis
MNLCERVTKQPTLTVSHGIWFEGDIYDYDTIKMMDTMKRWIRNSTHCISVDTNTIHACQLYFPKHIGKFSYIPNYVDLNIFKPMEKDYSGKFKVLFPRRIDLARGYVEMAQASRMLTDKYDDIEITFCGKGHPHSEEHLKKLLSGTRNVRHISYELHDMHKAYADAHVSCIPTIQAEGTSLACLESIATGTVPIATITGGLSDLVQDNVNGLLVMPKNVSQLFTAIEYLYQNRGKLNELRENGLRMIKAFGKDKWEAQVLQVIEDLFGESNA